MKKILIYSFLLAFLACSKPRYGETPDYISQVELKQDIIDRYTQDAWTLYMDEIIANPNHKNYSSPGLDTAEALKILKIIQAVSNSRSPQRDTVFNLYAIHPYCGYGFNYLSLKVQTDQPFIQNLAIERFPTGNATLDPLLQQFGFDSVKTAYNYPQFNWLTLYTKKSFNMLAVKSLFAKAPGVLISEWGAGCVGDGNRIALKRDENSATLTFSIGRGDCPAGCIYRRHWEFVVKNSLATFVRAY